MELHREEGVPSCTSAQFWETEASPVQQHHGQSPSFASYVFMASRAEHLRSFAFEGVVEKTGLLERYRSSGICGDQH